MFFCCLSYFTGYILRLQIVDLTLNYSLLSLTIYLAYLLFHSWKFMNNSVLSIPSNTKMPSSC